MEENSWVIVWGDCEGLFQFTYWDGGRGPVYFKTRKEAHKRAQKLIHQMVAADLRPMRYSEYLKKRPDETRNNRP